ncbi:AbiJ-NTD4 domain-containing protein [Anaerospora hongkongensis]|uniref:AbiJ-NTD4 domain-containing protein n=1 Tax=Anaerospora hongkongensis TaxID=244830 RepID=UPI002FDA855B
MLFSQRYGFKPIKQIIQKDDVDDDLKNSLWNALTIFYWESIDQSLLITRDRYHKSEHHMLFFFKIMWHSYFKKPIDTLGIHWDTIYKFIRNYFFSCPWFEIYDFIQFVALRDPNQSNSEKFINLCNKILETEMSGYRFVDGSITPITNQEEIDSIEQALKSPNKYNAATIHLKASLTLLSDRKNPDYRNSIKESISAVEAACVVIAEDPKATLGKALKIIESKPNIELHSSLKGAFDKLYGYTSDAHGIRHALLDESNLKFEDAKFMLISCSAFVNYLIDKSKNS